LFGSQFSVPDRALVILIENGGVDLGIPMLVDKALALVPGSELIPDAVKQQLVEYVRQKIKTYTDNLIETAELLLNRYSAAKPDLYGDIVILRDSTATYKDLKTKLIALSNSKKIIDLIILTHGDTDYISIAGGVDGQKIRALKTENGKPLSLRSVYMMNCVGSSLNSAWTDAGAKVSAGQQKITIYRNRPLTFSGTRGKQARVFRRPSRPLIKKQLP
jgi:hypothetical protein